MIGPSQWEPQVSFLADIGPDALWFVRNFRRHFGCDPEYIAAGGFALGLVFEECVHAGSLEDTDLLAAAANLDCYTVGRFRLGSTTQRQAGQSHPARAVEQCKVLEPIES